MLFHRQLFSILLLLLASLYGARPTQQHAEESSHPAFAEKIPIPGVSDAGKVNDFLYRGSQPNEQGIEELHKLGVTMIVDLRGEFKATRERERQEAQKLGMRFVSIPGNGWSPPTDEQVAQFLSLIQERPRQRIFVHCWFGGDRSGVFLAVHRLVFEHWTPEQALKEMKAFHFKGLWHPAMKKYIRDFPNRLENSPELARFRDVSSGR